MANLAVEAKWEAAIYQIATTDPRGGGPNGIVNVPFRQLANRSEWLKKIADEVVSARGSYSNLLARLDALLLLETEHRDKAYLKELWMDIETFVRYNLDLNLNPRMGIFPDRHGIDFCGYRIWPTHIKPRKSTVKRAKRRLKKIARTYENNPAILQHAHDSFQSFLGYITHCSGKKSTLSLLESVVFRSGHGNVKKMDV
jgi:hypothetical protein